MYSLLGTNYPLQIHSLMRGKDYREPNPYFYICLHEKAAFCRSSVTFQLYAISSWCASRDSCDPVLYACDKEVKDLGPGVKFVTFCMNCYKLPCGTMWYFFIFC